MVNKNHNNTPWYVLNAPELGGAFHKMEKLLQEDGVLEEKTDALVQLALAAIFRDPIGVEEDMEKAMALGASREEITEVLLMVAIQSAKAHLSWIKEIGAKHLVVENGN